MALVRGIEKRSVYLEIDTKQAIISLAKDLGIYCLFQNNTDTYYKVKENKIYKYTDISHHGSPYYEEELYSDDELSVANYKLINEILEINKIDIEH